MNKRGISIAVAVAFIVMLAGWHIGGRWYSMSKVYRNPQARHRVAVVPKELDIVDLRVTQGITCRIGYAEFIIPTSSPVDLKKSANGITIIGKSDSMNFIFLEPFNPTETKELVEYKSELAKLPKEHSLQKHFASAGATDIDIRINLERATPQPFWKYIFEDRYSFVFNTLQLLLKGAMPCGSSGVYTYQTPESRGLIWVGRKNGDVSEALVSIENRTGTLAVAMDARLPDGKDGNIMDALPHVMKTFHFTVKGLDSKNQIKELISGAGIPPRQE